jgi:hypothetical protein
LQSRHSHHDIKHNDCALLLSQAAKSEHHILTQGNSKQ